MVEDVFILERCIPSFSAKNALHSKAPDWAWVLQTGFVERVLHGRLRSCTGQKVNLAKREEICVFFVDPGVLMSFLIPVVLLR